MGQPLPLVPEVVSIALGKDLRLAGIPPLVEKITSAYLNGAKRIELDASRLLRLTEGARWVLISATRKLKGLGVELVITESG